ESSAWMALTLRRNRKRNTTWSWQSTLPFAADAVEKRGNVAATLQFAGLLTQVCAWMSIRGNPGSPPKAIFHFAALLELGAAAASLAAFVCFLSHFHNRLHLLTAEFIFAQTDGSVLIWPADFQLQLGPCAVFLATGGTLSLLSSFLLLNSHAAKRTRKEDTVQRVRRPPLHRSKTSTRAAGELLFEASVLKMKSHDRRIVAAVLVAMTLLALLLGLMAFLLGRGGVEDGVSKAFRGPQDGVRRTALVAQAISHAVGASTRMLGRGIGVVTSFAGAVFQKAAAGTHVLVAVVTPWHRMLQHAVFQAFSGIGQAAKWLADAADAAAQSPSATAKAVPELRVTQEAHGNFMERLRGGKKK
ncbi:unnamed protein product, partial [Symbiodinium sp. CCMP2456]